MGRKSPVIPIACTALAVAAFTALLFARDSIVINHGIRAYTAARLACAAIMAACAVWTAVTAALFARARRSEPDEKDPELPVAPDRKTLTEDGRRAAYKELASFQAGKWSNMKEIPGLLAQLDSMDEYQAELGPLLEQTAYLKEKPAEIVQRVEDCMYVNILKLLNYMRVLQTKDPATMAAKIHECLDKNADLLKKTDDFVVAVVGYVNGDIAPGEEQKTKDYVDSYMFVVLEAIELPETYLR